MFLFGKPFLLCRREFLLACLLVILFGLGSLKVLEMGHVALEAVDEESGAFDEEFVVVDIVEVIDHLEEAAESVLPHGVLVEVDLVLVHFLEVLLDVLEHAEGRPKVA